MPPGAGGKVDFPLLYEKSDPLPGGRSHDSESQLQVELEGRLGPRRLSDSAVEAGPNLNRPLPVLAADGTVEQLHCFDAATVSGSCHFQTGLAASLALLIRVLSH